MLGYWNNRHLQNVLFLTFEEMKSDLSAVLDKVSQFLGKSIQAKDKPRLLDHLSFDSMKKNAAVNKQDFVQVAVFFEKKTLMQFKICINTEQLTSFNHYRNIFLELIRVL